MAFVHEWTATNMGVDLIRYAMLYILVGAAVMVAISIVGLVLACAPPSRLRGFVTAVYLCAGLPSWVFLGFVSVSAIALQRLSFQKVKAARRPMTGSRSASGSCSCPAAR